MENKDTSQPAKTPIDFGGPNDNFMGLVPTHEAAVTKLLSAALAPRYNWYRSVLTLSATVLGISVSLSSILPHNQTLGLLLCIPWMCLGSSVALGLYGLRGEFDVYERAAKKIEEAAQQGKEWDLTREYARQGNRISRTKMQEMCSQSSVALFLVGLTFLVLFRILSLVLPTTDTHPAGTNIPAGSHQSQATGEKAVIGLLISI